MTGTSVIGVKFKDGVVIAADNLGEFTLLAPLFTLNTRANKTHHAASYGSLARFTDVHRLRPFNQHVCLGFGGDVSDMQHLNRMLTALETRENYSLNPESPSAAHLHAGNLHTYLQKVLYKRRTDMNPLWNVILIAGLDGLEQPYLASVDLLGTTFTAPTLATGFGAHLAQPILRRRVPDEEAAKEVTREEAVELVKECMKVLFYRDARSMDVYSIAVVTKEGGVELKEGEKIEGMSWAFADRVKGLSFMPYCALRMDLS